MSFLGEPFKHDLFVSYSHGDFDGSGESNLKKWSQAFVYELERELRQHPKFAGLRIFIDQYHRPDQGLDPMMPLAPQLREEIGAAGLLMVLMSPSYLSSKWCADERDWWVECQAKHGLSLDGRIFVVRVWPTDDPWPKVLLDERGEPLVGFTFYDLKMAPSYPWPHEWPDPTGAKGPFRQALLQMVGRIWQTLQAVQEQLGEHRRRADELRRLLKGESPRVLYLHARRRHAEAWERAADVLVDRGFIVLPGEPDSMDSDLREVTEGRVETLNVCDAFLLLGAEDPRTFDVDLITLGRQNFNLGRLLPCAVINTRGTATATRRRKEVARALGIGWIDLAGDDWPTEVLNWLNETRPSRESAPVAYDDKPKKQVEKDESVPNADSNNLLSYSTQLKYDVFLAYARKDIQKASYIAKELERQGYSVFWDTRILPGEEWRERIMRTLSEATCVLVAWSSHSIKSRWVVDEADESMKQGKYIPLLFDGIEIPLGYRQIQATDLTAPKPSTQSESFQSLLKAIAVRARPQDAGRRSS